MTELRRLWLRMTLVVVCSFFSGAFTAWASADASLGLRTIHYYVGATLFTLTVFFLSVLFPSNPRPPP